jgi:hypothetical protein
VKGMDIRRLLMLSSFLAVVGIGIGGALGLGGVANAAPVRCADSGCFGREDVSEAVSNRRGAAELTHRRGRSRVAERLAERLRGVSFMTENDYREVTSEVTRRSGRAERTRGHGRRVAGCGRGGDSPACASRASRRESERAHASSSVRPRGDDRRHERPRREPRNHRRTRVVSETVAAPVPEPTAALLFGAGLLVASHVNRRKQH